MSSGRVRERHAQLDVPPEPPAGSVVVSLADREVRQSRDYGHGSPLAYPKRGDLFGALTWAQLLSYGPVEVIWRPDAELPDTSARTAARELLALIDGHDPDGEHDVEVRTAAARLRHALDGDLAADASGAPG
jgi:hypothetical protein